MSWSLHPFHLVDCSSDIALIISTESTYTSETKKKRKVRGIVPKRQTFRKRSENVKQSELWPSVRGVTQCTEKSPFLSQYNNITDLFGGVVCFPGDTSTDDIPVQMSFLHHPSIPSGNNISTRESVFKDFRIQPENTLETCGRKPYS